MRWMESTLIEVIRSKTDWDSLVNSFNQSDFYHTYDYHLASKMENEDAILLKYSKHNYTIALPLLIREIKGTFYKDATSVYGYAGPLSLNIDTDFDNSLFLKDLNLFFNENNIISVFSRLNPFIENQNLILKKIGITEEVGNIVNIDIIKSTKIQFSAYHRRLRTYINKSRNLCSTVRAKTIEELFLFMEMYYENMRRLNAKKHYFFDEDYFIKLFQSKNFVTEVLLTIDNDTKKVIAGAMFIKKNDIVQYHLSGAKEEFLHLNAIKLMIDEMRIISSREGYKYFNLGGGLGSREDSLFRFKSSFSKDFRPFKVWKYVVDNKAYLELTKLRQCPKLNDSCINYFPLYRCCVDIA